MKGLYTPNGQLLIGHLPNCTDVTRLHYTHKYSTASIFAKDINDHHVIATVKNTKMPKTQSRIIVKRNMKHFSEQDFFMIYLIMTGKKNISVQMLKVPGIYFMRGLPL